MTRVKGRWGEERIRGKRRVHSEKRASSSKSAAGLCLAIINPISGWVRIACSSLIIPSLLQVVNRLSSSLLSGLFIHRLDASCFDNSHQVCKYHVETSLIFTGLLQLDEVTDLLQAGIFYNLQQVRGVSGCVKEGGKQGLSIKERARD